MVSLSWAKEFDDAFSPFYGSTPSYNTCLCTMYCGGAADVKNPRDEQDLRDLVIRSIPLWLMLPGDRKNNFKTNLDRASALHGSSGFTQIQARQRWRIRCPMARGSAPRRCLKVRNVISADDTAQRPATKQKHHAGCAMRETKKRKVKVLNRTLVGFEGGKHGGREKDHTIVVGSA